MAEITLIAYEILRPRSITDWIRTDGTAALGKDICDMRTTRHNEIEKIESNSVLLRALFSVLHGLVGRGNSGFLLLLIINQILLSDLLASAGLQLP